MADPIVVTLLTLIPQIPFVLIALVGLGFAISRRARHPRVSRWAAAGFACLIGDILVRGWIQLLLIGGADERPASTVAFAGRLMFWNAIATAMLVAALVALTVAVFVDRPALASRR